MKIPAIALMLVLGVHPVRAELTVETGVDVILDPQSKIEALHRLSVLGGGPALRYGQSIYSAAAGDAGGAFFWGYEVASALPLSPRLALKAGGFIGGGGGAAQVNGDGLMLRGSLGLSYRATDRLLLDAGIVWIGIDGAAVDGPALSFGLALQREVAGDRPEGAGLRVSSVSAGASVISMQGLGRSGLPQGRLALVGAQARLPLSDGFDAVVFADGAASGGEGYMQVLAGVRKSYPLGPARVFGQAALGFGGGGDVDTGGGGLMFAGVGASLPLGARHSIEATLAKMVTAGQAEGTMLSLYLARDFDRSEVAYAAQKWRLSTGLTYHRAHPGFRRGGAAGADVLLQETSFDMMLSERVYLVGTAGTTVQGDAAGYAIGMLGLGYGVALGERFGASVEAHVGAAGGGGIDVAGGAVMGLRVEMDYRLTPGLSLSVGAGKLRTASGDGMSPVVLHAGVKIDFQTN